MVMCSSVGRGPVAVVGEGMLRLSGCCMEMEASGVTFVWKGSREDM